MTGLEALEYLKENKRKHWLDDDKSTECLDTIETELKRLEEIGNSHLVAIPRMSGKTSPAEEVIYLRIKLEDLEKIIHEDEEIFDIIQRKEPSLERLRLTANFEHYNKIMPKRKKLTEYEYKILKEWFK